ncbi:hypothetical protein Mapa_013853 [Marchantia paleacea]|nr:hypothetical protein Mapa_013853 [Marchantia paleacea]
MRATELHSRLPTHTRRRNSCRSVKGFPYPCNADSGTYNEQPPSHTTVPVVHTTSSVSEM